MRKARNMFTETFHECVKKVFGIDGQVNAKTLASLTTSPLTNFTPPLTLIRYF